MQKKHTVISVLTIVVLALGAYIFWPQNSLPAQNAPDASVQSAKIMDRLADKFPVMANSSLDARVVINGIKVPPVPDAKINNATIAGVDSDGNGVRDDIDRLIAEKFGNDPIRHHAVTQYEQSLQLVLLNPKNRNMIGSYKDKLECLSSPVLTETSKITRALVNTKERGYSYASALAGTGRGNLCPEGLWIK